MHFSYAVGLSFYHTKLKIYNTLFYVNKYVVTVILLYDISAEE